MVMCKFGSCVKKKFRIIVFSSINGEILYILFNVLFLMQILFFSRDFSECVEHNFLSNFLEVCYTPSVSAHVMPLF